MKAFLVYETSWGNTKMIAQAICDGLSEYDIDPEVCRVQDAPPLHTLHVNLLIVGAPTHAFGLSRAGTRQDAHRRGGGFITWGVREWLETGPAALQVATFDTHVRRPKLPGHAGRKTAKSLKKLGCTLVTKPESFTVEGYEGPLSTGELDRAHRWGRELGHHLTQQAPEDPTRH